MPVCGAGPLPKPAKGGSSMLVGVNEFERTSEKLRGLPFQTSSPSIRRAFPSGSFWSIRMLTGLRPTQ